MRIRGNESRQQPPPQPLLQAAPQRPSRVEGSGGRRSGAGSIRSSGSGGGAGSHHPSSFQSLIAWVAGLLLLLNVSSLYVFLQSGLSSRSRAASFADIRTRSQLQEEVAEAEAALQADMPIRVRKGGASRPRRVRQGAKGRTFRIVSSVERGAHVAWNASDDSLLLSLEGRWDVRPFSQQPGVFLLQQTTDFACVLLIQDACYLFMDGHSPLHSPSTGIWFAEDRARDLSKIPLANDVCTLYNSLIAEEQEKKWSHMTPALASIGTHSVHEDSDAKAAHGSGKIGAFSSHFGTAAGAGRKASAGSSASFLKSGASSGDPASLGNKDWEAQDVAAKGYDPQLFDELDEDEIMALEMEKFKSQVGRGSLRNGAFSGAAAGGFLGNAKDGHEKGLFKMAPKPSGIETLAAGFSDEFDELPHDISDLKRKHPKVYGQLVSYEAMGRYVNASSMGSKKSILEGKRAQKRMAGVVPKSGSYMANFAEHVLPLLEVADHFLPPPPPHAAVDDRGANFSVFFPGEKDVQSMWTSEISHLLFGPKANVVGGQHAGQKICFQNALFAINKLHTVRTADLLRHRSYLAASSALQNGHDKLDTSNSRSPASSVISVKVVAPKWLEGEGSNGKKMSAGARTTHEAKVGAEDGSGKERKLMNVTTNWQITIIEREGGRSVKNLNDVVRLAHETFPELPVVVAKVGAASAKDQATLMKKSLVTIGMHGAQLSSIIFMPRGTVLLELLPYKFFSTAYKKIALRSGLNYLHWQNMHSTNAFFVENCLKVGGFTNLRDEACWRVKECVYCVRDKSITRVTARELSELMQNARTHVRMWLPNVTS